MNAKHQRQHHQSFVYSDSPNPKDLYTYIKRRHYYHPNHHLPVPHRQVNLSQSHGYPKADQLDSTWLRTPLEVARGTTRQLATYVLA